jgi:hypothetical protein
MTSSYGYQVRYSTETSSRSFPIDKIFSAQAELELKGRNPASESSIKGNQGVVNQENPEK